MLRIKHKNIFTILGLLAFSLSVLLGIHSANATDSPISLQVSPTKQKLELKPGDSYSSSFEVMNIGKNTFSYSTAVAPYWVTDEDYSANYETNNNYTQIADWVTFDPATSSGTINPGDIVEVNYTVNVPLDVPAGGQYAALLAQTEDGNEDDANIQVVNRVGTILYAKVDGETREEGKILKNSVPFLRFDPPVSAVSVIENTGNVELTADYTMRVWPLFSGETVFDNTEKPEHVDIMPDTKRATTKTWDDSPHIGIFKVEQTIKLLGEESKVSRIVVLCPLWLMVIILIVIALIVFKIVSVVKKGKKSGRR